jgi:hypothetical protein
MLSGDFSAITTVQLKNPVDGTPLTNNQMPQELISTVTRNIVKTFPTPLDASGRVVSGQVAGQDEDLVTARVDWQVSAKHSIFGRFLDANLDKKSTFDGGFTISNAAFPNKALQPFGNSDNSEAFVVLADAEHIVACGVVGVSNPWQVASTIMLAGQLASHA